MKKINIILITALTIFSHSILAENLTETDSIPQYIQNAQDKLAQEAVCQAQWRSYNPENSPVANFAVGNQHSIYIVPCANWAINMTWVVYLKNNTNGVFTSQLTFNLITPLKELHTSQVVHNIRWHNNTLFSSYYVKSSSDCGTKTKYKWNESTLAFDIESMYIKAGCGNTHSDWEKVY